MKTAGKWHILFVLAILAYASNAWSAGFEALQFAPRHAGNANAVTAIVDDYAALFFNPAGLVLDRKSKFTIGANVYLHDLEFSEPRVEGGTAVPLIVAAEGTAGFSYTMGYVHHFADEKLAIGIAAYSPYKAFAYWGTESSAADTELDYRYLATEMEFDAYYISAGIAWQPDDKWGVGASISWVPSRYSFRSFVDMGEHIDGYPTLGTPLDSDARREHAVAQRSRLKMDYVGTEAITGVIGAWYNPTNRLRIGVSYQPRVALKMSGSAAISKAFDPDVTEFTKLDSVDGIPDDELFDYYFFNNDDSELNLYLPQKMRFGIAVSTGKSLYFSADIVHTAWSGLSDSNINDPNFTKNLFSYRGPSFSEWEDTLQFNFGVFTALGRKTNRIQFRAGYSYDESAIPNEYLEISLIDATKHIVSVGATLGMGERAALDFSIAHAFMPERRVLNTAYEDRSTSQVGESGAGYYRSAHDSVGLTFSYAFGEIGTSDLWEEVEVIEYEVPVDTDEDDDDDDGDDDEDDDEDDDDWM